MSEIRRILVPIDFSEPSRAAFDYAVELAKSCGAAVDVLHVWEAPDFLPPGSAMSATPGLTYAELVRKAADEALENFVAEARNRGIKVNASEIQMGRPAHAITEAALAGGYDLVVLGTHGRTGFSRALIGSVAENVVRHAHCPVLTVRPRR
jgi:nucleotide-binding universal stress UspA family protein